MSARDSEKLPLEDSAQDIVAKAMRGLGLEREGVMKSAGVDATAWQRALAGEDEEALAKIASVLALDACALAGIAAGRWRPQEVEVAGLRVFTTWFGFMQVNACAVWDRAARVAAFFDTGAEPEGMRRWAEQQGLAVRFLFLTHTHADHAVDAEATAQALGARLVVHAAERIQGAEVWAEGQVYEAGRLRIEPRHTWGHSPGGTTYVVHGLEGLVAVVGDAVFAGSIGGPKVSYEAALETAQRHILSLPDETVLVPGHGPLTTVGEEKRHNPFFAGRV